MVHVINIGIIRAYRALLIETLTYKYKSTQGVKDFNIKKNIDGFIFPIPIKEVP